MQFAFFKILMEEHDFQDVALQQMDDQDPHCDPHAHGAKPDNENKECHVLITMQGEHDLAVSSSSLIQTMVDRFKTWKGGRASVKVGDEHLDDIFIMPRQGARAFQAARQWLLGGNTTGALSEKLIVTLHAGIPFGIPGTGNRWITSQELIQMKHARAQEFRRVGGDGVVASTSMLANFRGTPEASAAVVANAATRVLKVFRGRTEVALPITMRIHKRDLVVYQEKYNAGKISNLSKRKSGFWSEGRKVAHKERSEGGGGSEEGSMVRTVKDEHVKASEEKGGCPRGPMPDGPAKDEHVKACKEKGGTKKGTMTKDERDIHSATMVAGYKKKNAILFQLANGKVEQESEWTVSCRCRGKDGGTVIYTFSNEIDDPIIGKGAFEAYLLEEYVSEELTKDGKSALETMKKKRDEKV